MGYTYTARGELDTITAINGGSSVVTNTYTYNRRGLPTRERMTWNNIDWSITYGYDANGHVAVQGYPGGVSVDYAPNALGQATQAGSYATNVAYFPNGAMRSFTYGNGIVHTLTQNARGLPDRSVDAYGSTRILDDGYDYDGVGNVAAISDGATGRNQKGNRTMAYDGLNRLTSVTALDMFGTASYAYDVQDNLTHVQVTAGSQPRNVDYCYDAANRLTNIQSAAATYCGGATVTGLGYDVQGNLANKDGVLYAFDLGNRLRSVSSPASGYVYDGHGRRVRDVTAGSRYSLYSRSGQLVFASSMREAAQLRYISLNGSLVAVDKLDTGTGAVSVVYQHTDALGSPVATTNASRTVIERREYEPYGYQISPFALEDGPGYTGHMADAATGLVYMQQRYYDPLCGCFLSTDPVTARSGSFNRYWYANANPFRFIDPDGRDGKQAPCNGNGWCRRARHEENQRRGNAPYTWGSGGVIDRYTGQNTPTAPAGSNAYGPYKSGYVLPPYQVGGSAGTKTPQVGAKFSLTGFDDFEIGGAAAWGSGLSLLHSFGSGSTKGGVIVVGRGANASADFTVARLSYRVPGGNPGDVTVSSGFDVDVHDYVGGSLEFSGDNNGWDLTFKLGVGFGAMWKGVAVDTDLGN